jgi:hypothetical protein
VENDSLELIKGFAYTDEKGKFRVEVFPFYFQKKHKLKVGLIGYESKYNVMQAKTKKLKSKSF